MSSSTTLQAAWRRYDCRRTYRRALERFHASVLIQRAWRQARLWSTLKHEAATTIQRVWKGFWCLVQYHTDLMDVVAVQACIRRYLATQARRKAIRAATVLENGWRFYHRRKQFTSELHEKRVAIICQVRSRAHIVENSVGGVGCSPGPFSVLFATGGQDLGCRLSVKQLLHCPFRLIGDDMWYGHATCDIGLLP